MKRFSLLLTVALAALSAHAADPTTAPEFVARGRELLAKRDYAKALADFDAAVKLDTKNPYPLVMRAYAHVRLQMPQRAVADCDAALKLNDKYAPAYETRGDAHIAARDYKRALADLDTAVSLNPKSVNALQLRARVWDLKKDGPKALADYGAVLKLQPDHKEARKRHALLLQAAGKFEEALADFDVLVSADPKVSSYYAFRAQCYEQMGSFRKAEIDYTAAIERAKTSTSYSGRGRCRLSLGDGAGALADFTEVVKLFPGQPAALSDRASAYALLKEYPKAVADYEAALAQFKPARVATDYARLLATCPDAKVRDGKRALALVRGAIDGKEATDAKLAREVRDTYAAALAETGDFAGAVEQQTKALELLVADKGATAEERKQFEARLALYKAKKPYRKE